MLPHPVDEPLRPPRPPLRPPQNDPCGLCPPGLLSELCYLISREQNDEGVPVARKSA